ncbi:hypothetical protein LCGC14_2008630, partial [marine sediment metagenome]
IHDYKSVNFAVYYAALFRKKNPDKNPYADYLLEEFKKSLPDYLQKEFFKDSFVWKKAEDVLKKIINIINRK